MTKSELRKVYLSKRQELLANELAVSSQKIADNFFNHFDLSRIRVLHCFISIEKFNEVDTSRIFKRVWDEAPNVQTVVPRVTYETGALESLKYGPDTTLAHNRWQISEPSHDERVEPQEIDLVIVPLVCFAQDGHRVGYGKGFYDRFLKTCRDDCLKIGLSFFGPVERIEEASSEDVRIDFCITPDRVFALKPFNPDKQVGEVYGA